MMSNALYSMFTPILAEGPAVGQVAPELSPHAEGLLWALLSIGVIMLAIVVIRRARNPQKLLLSNAPARPNRISPLVVLVVFVIWVASTFGLRTLLVGAPDSSADAAGSQPASASAPAESQPAPATAPSETDDTQMFTSTGGLLATLGGQIVGISACLLAAGLGFRHGIVRGMGLSFRHVGFDLIRGVAALLAALPVVLGMLVLSTWILTLLAPHAPHEHDMLTGMQGAGSLQAAMIVLSAVVLGPLFEELLYRGLLQSSLRTYVGPWGAILMTAGLFGAMHMDQPQAIASLVVLGLVLGYNYERCGRLSSPLLIHALFNAIMILLKVI